MTRLRRKTNTKRHIPERMCVGCRQVKPKHELVRLVHNPGGRVTIDQSGRAVGRGAYLCRKRECWDAVLTTGKRKGRLAHALKATVSSEDQDILRAYGRTLPAQ